MVEQGERTRAGSAVARPFRTVNILINSGGVKLNRRTYEGALLYRPAWPALEKAGLYGVDMARTVITVVLNHGLAGLPLRCIGLRIVVMLVSVVANVKGVRY